MNDKRAAFLAALVLWVLTGAARAEAQTWYYAVTLEDLKTGQSIKLPEGYYNCDGYEPDKTPNATPPRAVTFDKDGSGSGLTLKVGQDQSCSSPRKVQLEWILNLSQSGADTRFVDARQSSSHVEFLFSGSSIWSQDAARLRENTRLSVVTAGISAEGGHWLSSSDHVSYAFQDFRGDTALPPRLELSFGPARAPGSSNVYDKDGARLTPSLRKVVFEQWLIREEYLRAVLPIPEGASWAPGQKHKGVISPLLPVIQRALSAPTCNTSNTGPLACISFVNRDVAQDRLEVEVTFQNRPREEFAAKADVPLSLSLDTTRLATAFTPTLQPVAADGFKLTLLKSACSYSIQQVTPLYTGLQGGRLYLRVRGLGTAGQKCMTGNAFESLRVQGLDGVQFDPNRGVKHLLPDEGFPASSQDETWLELTVQNVPMSSTDASTPLPQPGLALLYLDGSRVKLEGAMVRPGTQATAGTAQDDRFILRLQVSSPPDIKVSPRILYGPLEGGTGDRRDSTLSVDGFQGLAVGRANVLTLEAADLQDWQVEVASAHVRSCSTGVGSIGSLCVVPTRETTAEPLVLKVTYRPSRDTAGLPGYAGSDERLRRVSLGSKQLVTQLDSRVLNRALDLEERAQVYCRHTDEGSLETFFTEIFPGMKPGPVVATAFTGPRALPFQDVQKCEVRIRLNSNGGTAQVEGDSQQEAAAEDAQLANVLRELGKQTLRIKARLPAGQSRDRDAEVFTKTVSIDSSSFSKFERRDGAIVIPLTLKVGGDIKLGDYDIIEVQVAHADPTQYQSGDDSMPESSMTAQLRVMPQWLAARVRRGIGPRLFFTAQIPTGGLVRIYNSGIGATSSSSYRLVESAAFGIGALGVVEIFDFDRAAPSLPVNPQLHGGVLLTATPQAGLQPPRLSYVLGLGLRVLGGDKKAGTDAGLSTVFWLEWADRARHESSLALLVGLSVNIGSFPN